MARVHFRKENITVYAPDGSNLRELCLEYGVDPYPALGGALSCRGKGMCGTCAVSIDDGGDEHVVSPLDRKERSWLKRVPEELRGELRLSCRVEVRGDCTVNTSPDMREGWKKHGYYSGRPMRSWES